MANVPSARAAAADRIESPSAPVARSTNELRVTADAGREAEVHEFDTPADVPQQPDVGPRDVVLAPDFDVAEVAIGRGVDSARVAVIAGDVDADWLGAMLARPAGQPVAPPAAHRFPERLLVVVPTYNEAENLERLIAAIGRHLVCDVLVVDDGSPDGTGAIADRIATQNPRVHVLHRDSKRGLGRAYLAGFEWALARGYERVFEMDCDFSHAPWDLPRLAHASLSAELVIGSRYVDGGCTEGWSGFRRLVSRFGNFYARAWLGLPLHDMTAGYRCFRSTLLRAIDFERVTSNGYAFQVEMTWRAHELGARIREIPVHFVDRDAGRSKMNRSIALEAMRKVPMLRMRG